MKIHLPSYSKAVHLIEETIEPAELDLDTDLFREPIHVKVLLDRHDPYLDCKFTLQTTIHPNCDRCLESFDMQVKAEAPMLYVLGKAGGGDDVDDADVLYIPPNTVDLDITADLRDLLILAVSGQHVCKEDCLGLCPICGMNLNLETCKCEQLVP